MNDQANGPDTYSPDALETQDKGSGVRRLNWLPLWIVGTLLVAALMSFVYTGELRSSLKMAQAASADQDKYRVSGVVPPPIVRPAGPDVTPESSPVYAMPGSSQHPGEPVMESDAARQAREKKAAALEAALKAEPGVEKFSQQPGVPGTNGTIPPPPPQQYRENDEAGGGENINEKRFLAGFNQDDSPYLKHTRMPAVSPYEIKAGAVIPGVMISGVNSGLPGQIVGQVRQDVYDSATGQFLLIPAGARLVGTYDSSISPGQERIFVAWQRIVYPDSSSISLDSMPGADQSGLAGFHDQVDNHYARTFGQAFMLSLFSAGIQLSQPRGAVSGTYNAQQIGAAAIGQQLGQLGMQIARRNLNMQPTLEIRPGFLFTIAVNKDMVLPGPWQGDSVAIAQRRE
ncbi:MAG TPA: TrbI/VirB10 family protein [Nitrosospira sp.]|nr:TrbI/VirB10 family protein [Nitrosospira sp.]